LPTNMTKTTSSTSISACCPSRPQPT
jgi:hypothetical protein